MKDGKIGIGLVGTGFARSAQAPAFQLCEGAELVAVCSGQHDNAVRTAAEFDIEHACENHEQLIALPEVDLVVVSAPPYLHRAIAMAALDAGKHVICEKPMAMNTAEAHAMADRAAAHQNQLAIIDHELRFNPTWRRMKELLDGGFIGDLRHIQMTIATGFRHSAQRPWNWWSQKSAGGGLLGALGSHAIDAIRWMFGEIDAVSATVATVITERRDARTGEMKPNETDDYVSFLCDITPHGGGSAHGTVLLSALFAGGGKNQLTAVGSHGTLMIEGDEMLLGTAGYNQPIEEMSLVDRALEIAAIPNNIWARSFYHLARETVQALREGRTEISHAASFVDGLQCQRMIDAIQRSQAERCSIALNTMD